MRKFCKTFCCCFMICKCCKKTDFMNDIDNNTRLLPDLNNNALSSASRELQVFGKLFPEFNKETLYINNLSKSAIRKIAFGDEHLLILFEDGSLFGLGKNNLGQLGQTIGKDGNQFSEFIRVDLNKRILGIIKANKYEVIDIACGNSFSLLFIKANNECRIIRLGINEEDKYKDDFNDIRVMHIEHLSNSRGSMSSNGSKESMVSSSIDLNIKNIYACGSRSLFITYDNRIYIGQKSFTMNPLSSYAFLCQVEKQIKLLELGEEHCLILDIDGNVYGLGDNTYGELGVDNVKLAEEPIKIKFFESVKTHIKKISAGARNSFVLLDTGEAYVFGDNSEGESTGMAIRYNLPNKVNFELEENDTIVDLFSGENHCFALTEKDKLYSWGNANFDKLGTNENSQFSCFPKHIQKLMGKHIKNVYLGKNVSLVFTN